MELKDVENLANLARLDMAQEEKEKILADMDSIIAYVKSIENADVGNIKPEYSHYNVWREDQMEDRDFSKEGVTGQFPNSQDGFLKVKKIL